MLFGIYPVLRIATATLDTARLGDCLMTIALMVAVTGIILWLLRFVITSLAKRAVIVSTFYLVFFHYLVPVVAANEIFTATTQLHNLLVHPAFALGVILLLVGLVLYGMRKSRSDFSTATVALDIFATAAVCSVILPFIGTYVTGSRDRWVQAARAIVNENELQEIQPSGPLPDIYYLIVDGYARSDVLQELYSLDNTSFLEDLEDRGFVVLKRSQSNYPQTYLSLASSLNMSYLDGLTDTVGPTFSDRRPLRYLIDNGSVIHLLRRVGYRFVLISSYFSATKENPQADQRVCETVGLNPVLNNTIAMSPLALSRPVQRFQHEVYRRQVLCGLRMLGDLAGLSGPKFVFAHIIAPHPPFVFGANGEERVPAGPLLLNDGGRDAFSAVQYRSGYRDQLTYLNARLLQVVDTILAQSATPPVIILQADHGPGSMLDVENPEHTNMTERLAILSAYLVPKDQRGLFYDSMTPVNTFRVLFNANLGTNLELLEDRSFFARWQYPYAFVRVWPDVSKDLATDGGSSPP
jgi:hypothetical protein